MKNLVMHRVNRIHPPVLIGGSVGVWWYLSMVGLGGSVGGWCYLSPMGLGGSVCGWRYLGPVCGWYIPLHCWFLPHPDRIFLLLTPVVNRAQLSKHYLFLWTVITLWFMFGPSFRRWGGSGCMWRSVALLMALMAAGFVGFAEKWTSCWLFVFQEFVVLLNPRFKHFIYGQFKVCSDKDEGNQMDRRCECVSPHRPQTCEEN